MLLARRRPRHRGPSRDPAQGLARIARGRRRELLAAAAKDLPANERMGAAVGRSHCNARLPRGLADDHHWPLAGQPFLPVDVQVRSTSPFALRLILKTSLVALDVEATSYSPATFSIGVEGVAEP